MRNVNAALLLLYFPSNIFAYVFFITCTFIRINLNIFIFKHNKKPFHLHNPTLPTLVPHDLVFIVFF